MVVPDMLVSTSEGRYASASGMFSTAATIATRFTFSFMPTTATKVPITLAPPHMSNFISSMPPWTLRLMPPVSKVRPLPTST